MPQISPKKCSRNEVGVQNKVNDLGVVVRNKARLLAKGFNKFEGSDSRRLLPL